MIAMAKMAQLVENHILKDLWRHKGQNPVEIDITPRPTTAPARSHPLDPDHSGVEPFKADQRPNLAANRFLKPRPDHAKEARFQQLFRGGKTVRKMKFKALLLMKVNL